MCKMQWAVEWNGVEWSGVEWSRGLLVLNNAVLEESQCLTAESKAPLFYTAKFQT